MGQRDWWQTMFDQKYLDTYLGQLTPERTEKEVGFVIDAAKLELPHAILDLACGHGRHTIELAKRGYDRVTGLDYSEVFLDKAVADAAGAGVDIRFVQGDMRALPFSGEFDAVLTIFTSLGFFDDATNKAVLGQVHKVLKPQGRFLMDVIRGEAVDKRFKVEGALDTETGLQKISRQVQMSGHAVDEMEWFDSERQVVHNHREWSEDGQKIEYDFWLHVYTMPQYEEMLSHAGFRILKTWGNFDGQPYGTEGTYRTIILTQKEGN